MISAFLSLVVVVSISLAIKDVIFKYLLCAHDLDILGILRLERLLLGRKRV